MIFEHEFNEIAKINEKYKIYRKQWNETHRNKQSTVQDIQNTFHSQTATL